MASNDRDDWTEQPLRAGSARVWPETLFVEHFSSRDDIVRRGNAGQLLRDALARRTDPAATSGEVFRDVPQWAKDFAGLDAHERDHIRRLSSTTFGLLTHALRSQQLAATRDLIVEAGRQPETLRLPIVLSAPTGPGPAQRAQAARALLKAVEHYVDLATFRSVEAAFASWAAPGCEYVLDELSTDSTTSTLAIRNAGPAKWLSAVHLLELFGALEHGNRLLGTGSKIDDVVELLEDIERTYVLPLLVWYTHFPTPCDQPTTPRAHTRPGELYLGFYRLFPLELLAAADLALWPPFMPEGLTVAGGEVGWMDICPAFRFARIITAFKSERLIAGEWPPGSLNDVVPEIQQRMCDRFGWPTPLQLASRWKEHLATGGTTWFTDAAVGGFRHRTILQLLSLRCERPGDVVVNNADYNTGVLCRVPGWITHEANGSWMSHTLVRDDDRQATELWGAVYSLMPALFDGGDGRLRHLRKASLDTRRAFIEAFDLWGRAAQGWPSEQFSEVAARLLATTT